MSASRVVVAVRYGAVPRCSVMASCVQVGDIAEVIRHFGPPPTQLTRLVGSVARHFTVMCLAFLRHQLWAGRRKHEFRWGPTNGLSGRTRPQRACPTVEVLRSHKAHLGDAPSGRRATRPGTAGATPAVRMYRVRLRVKTSTIASDDIDVQPGDVFDQQCAPEARKHRAHRDSGRAQLPSLRSTTDMRPRQVIWFALRRSLRDVNGKTIRILRLCSTC